MNRNCVAVLALVVASSCGNSDDRMRDIEALKRKNEELTKELDDTRGDVEVLKRESENGNRGFLQMKKDLSKLAMEFMLAEDSGEALNMVLNDLGLWFVSFSPYSFSLKNIEGNWKLCWDDGAMDLEFNRYKFLDTLWYWLFKSGKGIQGFEDFLKDEKSCSVVFEFLNFLNENELFGKKSCFGDCKFKEIRVENYQSFEKLESVGALEELFRICPNVKVKSKTGDFENFSCYRAILGLDARDGADNVLFKMDSGESFYLRVKNDDELENFKDFCNKKHDILEGKS